MHGSRARTSGAEIGGCVDEVPRGGIRSQPDLATVLTVGVMLRLVLIPITHGQDFVVWDMASTATLHGTNVYAHHPNYPGGPFAYVPLFLYLELPFQWVSVHSGMSFTILGKLPILAADVAVAVIIAAELRDRGHARRAVALGAAMFFLNPLVIYNSAYYGRFDSLSCALLLMSLRVLGRGRRGSRYWYALAVAAKTFPAFVLPGVLRASRGGRARLVGTLVLVVAALSVPYLGTWRPYLHDVVFYDASKVPQYLSWQRLLLVATDADAARLVGYLMLGVFALGVVWLGRIVSVERCVLLTFILFILCSKVVLEQYLTWPLPWLALAVRTTSPRIARASAALVAIFTAVGLFANPSVHPWGRSPWWIVVSLAAACAWYLTLVVHDSVRTQRHATRPRGYQSSLGTCSSQITGK